MYNANDEAKNLLAQALTELKAEGEDWLLSDSYLTLEADPTGDGSHWATSVKNEKTGQVRAVNFNIEFADGIRTNMDRETVASIKRALRNPPTQ